jgi:lysozyme
MTALTPRCIALLCSQEGIVPEAYKDSVGVWTWGPGLAQTGGYDPMRYKDKPQPLSVCLRATIDAVNSHYLPGVVRAFAGHDLTEAELAAALSFHWNTGAIGRAQWVKDVLAGRVTDAKVNILQWSSHGTITKRRTMERDLFFDGKWPSLIATVYEVAKPSYKPDRERLIDVMPVLQQIMGGK